MNIILNFLCFVQYNSNKVRVFKGFLNNGVEVDLMIVNIPKGLSISMVSEAATFVLE
jgi:hypothetical protein